MAKSRKQKIYAITQCRGDTKTNTCKRCVSEAVRDVQVVCDSRVEASVYYNFCSLGVSSENVQFNILHDMDMLAILGNQSHVTHNQLLNKALVSLIIAMTLFDLVTRRLRLMLYRSI